MLGVYKKLAGYAREKIGMLVTAIFASIASAVLQMLGFYYLYKLLEAILMNDEYYGAIKYAGYIGGFFAGGAIVYFISLLFSHLFAFRLETNLRKRGIEGLTNASFKFFDLNESGKTRKILDDNAAQTHAAVAHLIPDNAGAAIVPILTLVLGFIVNWRVGVILVICTVFALFLLFKMMGETKFMEIYQSALERLSAETVEYIRGMQVVKIFGVDVRNFKALNNAIKDYARYALNYSLSCRVPFTAFQVLFFGLISIILPMVILFLDVTVQPRFLVLELIMLFFLAGVLFTYIMRVMYVSMHLFTAKDSVEKLEKLYDDMLKDRLNFGSKDMFAGYDISFENVNFSYGDKPVLSNLSFTLKSGKTYALVGESGSGKSTIAKLISGFYNIDEGNIKIGGVPLTFYSSKAIIENIAFVFQNVKLFKRSIFENVALAKENASRDEVLRAMNLAGCKSIIDKLPNGENTIIGSKGIHLSGGEKQRIAIARAILKDAPIVIFDEASAAIDPDNEHELQKAFTNLMGEKTVIMIAHRLTSIRNVDEIIVLKDGEIKERGSHDELMTSGGMYKELIKLYNKANDWRVTDEKLA